MKILITDIDGNESWTGSQDYSSLSYFDSDVTISKLMLHANNGGELRLTDNRERVVDSRVAFDLRLVSYAPGSIRSVAGFVLDNDDSI